MRLEDTSNILMYSQALTWVVPMLFMWSNTFILLEEKMATDCMPVVIILNIMSHHGFVLKVCIHVHIQRYSGDSYCF